MPFHLIRPELEHLAIPVDSIHPNPDNPNNGDVDAVAESLTVNRQYAPIVVWLETGEILAGHTRYEAVLALGWTHIAAVQISAQTREEATRVLLADNRTGQRARMDQGLLLAALEVLPDLSGTGYEASDIGRLERLLSEPLVFEVSTNCPVCGK
jgi:ParB-like chromosome segregation protein Spo0J